jgi:cytochrome c2
MSDHDGVERVITMAWRTHPLSGTKQRTSMGELVDRIATFIAADTTSLRARTSHRYTSEKMVRQRIRANASLILLIATATVVLAWTLRAPARDIWRQVFELDPSRRQARSAGFKTIETELLPLRLTIDPVSERVDIALGGGAIEMIGDTLLLMDRLGHLFVYKDHKISEGGFPALPIHMKDFVDDARFPVTEGTLRAHDLRYDKAERFLYVSYDSYDNTAKAPRFTISRIAVSTNVVQPIGDWEPIYQSSPLPLRDYYAGRGAGGRMLITNRSLYFAIGDYSLDRIVSSAADIAAQNLTSPFGKAYRYDLKSKSLEMLSIGHRVPAGLAATSSGQILETEHGPRGGDELNIITKGANYGWPYVGYGTRYFSYRPYLDATAFTKTITAPVFAWVPSIAVTSLFESNRFDSLWNGDIVVGSLKAQSLFRLKIIEQRVIFAEPIWIGHRVRDMLEQDGRIVIWSDEGSLIVVTPDRELLAEDRLNIEDGYKNGVLSACSTCHSFARHNALSWAPTLNGIYGAKIAGDDFQNYSEALKSKRGIWDDGSLTAYLTAPQKFSPGTTMINPDLTAPQVSEVVRILKNLPRQ